MPRISGFELRAVELPFCRPFRHAAAERGSSESLFLKCVLDDGSVGFGESLPRSYVTGETRDVAFGLLRKRVLAHMVGENFRSLENVEDFLTTCDGKAPSEWVPETQPTAAAWCTVDLALLDAFARSFRRSLDFGGTSSSPPFSAVVSAESLPRLLWTLLKVRFYGFSEVKLKVGSTGSERVARVARRVLGKHCRIRVDANMSWSATEAADTMLKLGRWGIRSVEQPVHAEDLDGLAWLTSVGEADVIADESLTDRRSLCALIERRAATAVNVRISKCGGLISSLQRCAEARAAGLGVQLGCQVGESSLLSAAQLVLLSSVNDVLHAEGCFGRHLLRSDPVDPPLQFGRGGAAPRRPSGPGLGVTVDERRLDVWTRQRAVIGAVECGWLSTARTRGLARG